MESPPTLPRYDEVVYMAKDNETKVETPEQQQPSTNSVKFSFEFEIEVSLVRVGLNVLNTFTHFLLGGVVFCAFVVANKPDRQWYYYGYNVASHVYLCVIGYVMLMSQAILSFNAHGGWANGFKYPQKRIIHVAMQVCGSILAIIGCLIKIAEGSSGSVHGIFGWITMLLTILSLVGGVLNYKYTKKISETPYKNAHSYFGLFTLIMAYISICIPFGYPDVFENSSSAGLVITITVFALVGVLISGFIMIKNKTIKCDNQNKLQ